MDFAQKRFAGSKVFTQTSPVTQIAEKVVAIEKQF